MIAIVKPVGNYCNLRCSYCFYESTDQSIKEIMNEDIVIKLIREMSKLQPKGAKFIWHGGEPTLAGIDFFQTVVNSQKQFWPNGKVTNLIQTNATTITEEWARFFSENNFRVGVSIDGSEESHGLFRKKVGGRNSFRQVMRGIAILQNAELDLGFIQTITRDKLDNVKKDFTFFYEVLRAKSWANNVYFDPGCTNGIMKGQNVSADEWHSYLESVLDEWLMRDDPSLVVREIESIMYGALNKSPRECRFNGTCGNYICIESDGSAYPCDRFSGQSEYLWGNLNQSSLTAILGGAKRKEYIVRSRSSLINCKNCEWISACNNGCAHHRRGGIEGKYQYCEVMRKMLPRIKSLLGTCRGRR